MPNAEDFPCPDLRVTEKGTTTTLSQPLLLLNAAYDLHSLKSVVCYTWGAPNRRNSMTEI